MWNISQFDSKNHDEEDPDMEIESFNQSEDADEVIKILDFIWFWIDGNEIQ